MIAAELCDVLPVHRGVCWRLGQQCAQLQLLHAALMFVHAAMARGLAVQLAAARADTVEDAQQQVTWGIGCSFNLQCDA